MTWRRIKLKQIIINLVLITAIIYLNVKLLRIEHCLYVMAKEIVYGTVTRYDSEDGGDKHD